METRINRAEIIGALAALERALDERLVIVREIIKPDGTIVRTIRRSVLLPKKKK